MEREVFLNKKMMTLYVSTDSNDQEADTSE